MSVGENIKNLRNKSKLTQVALAEKLCVSSKTVSSWENNHNVPDIYMLINLSEIFNTSIDEILGIEKNNKELKENYRKNKFKDNLLKIIFIAILVGIPILFFRYVNIATLAIIVNESVDINLDTVNFAEYVLNMLTFEYIIYLGILLVNYILYSKNYKYILLVLNLVIFVFTLSYLVYEFFLDFSLDYIDYLLFLIASVIGLYWSYKILKNKSH